ncbi:MAG: hypothetical protein DI530_05055 [Sphingomonas sp.]|uniref:Uncharacterized protein n=1 Tax=Sphingomonas adhaesiva TaxID=28212 RepID=A0A2A4I800_9SPHN|nr:MULTISPECIES: hypothetical protein [Sphingomonas]PCG14306.1 hypothetical protein COA07_11035 [Sphingomonas adhaesiva]PZU80644.1 MAG: hypothetical protein DI530_05055 [Sphingomonas sp.]
MICESDVSGGGVHGGSVTVATIDDGRIISLQKIAKGLVDPSSAVVFSDRAYFLETRYCLLMDHQDDLSAIVSGVPFCVQSTLLPGGDALRGHGGLPDRPRVPGRNDA